MKDLVTKGQDLETYAKKSGGIDKNDMMKVAAMLKKGNKSGAVKYAMGLDTDPKEYILNLIGEEVGLNEDNLDLMRKASKGSAQTLKMKDGNLKMDSFTASAIMQIYDKINDKNKKTFENMMKNGKKADILKLQKFAMSKINSEYVPEELELDEGKMGDQWQKGAKSVKSGPFELMRGKSGVHAIMQNGKKLGDFSYDDEADNFVANMKGMKGQWVGNDIDSLINHLQKVHKEELELDEKVEYVEYKFRNKNDAMKAKAMLDAVQLMSFDVEDDDISNGELRVDAGNKDMTKYHKEIMKKFRPKVMTQEKVEIEEASAAADARRAMRRDPEMKQRAFSKDDSATDDDKKAASKNIMMQMRKAQSLNGKFDVEFQDGKKVKIPAKMAIAVQQKYNSMRKPSDKEKFQAKVGKSYRDMLNALKEAVSPAQQAAIAISKKERGEKPKKESILDRIDRKIKENKNG